MDNPILEPLDALSKVGMNHVCGDGIKDVYLKKVKDDYHKNKTK